VTQVLGPPRGSLRPEVDPRFRQRWAEARRAEGRRRLHALVAMALVVATAGGAVALLHSPVFRVKNVVVVGNTHTPAAEVVAAAGLNSRQLMIDTGSGAADRAVEALPWVATASFTRHWPWTLIITVRERSAAALVAVAGGSDVVDRTGRVLEVLPAREQFLPLPVVEDARGARAGQRVSPGAEADAAQLAELLSAAAVVPAPLARTGLELAPSPALGLLAYVGPAKTMVLLGDLSQIAMKWAVLEELTRQLALSGYAQVDLRVPQRPALTPQPNAGNT